MLQQGKAMDIVFKNLSVYTGGKCIVDGVSGMAKEQELLAVMGPSGGGKTTLLNALAGRCNNIKGQVLYNNREMDPLMKHNIGYVLQEDVFFPNLTLKETLTYYARLKLPEKMPYYLKMQRVDEIIDILQLTKCSTTVMGNFIISGLSGGEKKRASIACELLTNPLLLFLDEPTSGLDSAVAFKLMDLIMKYAKDTDKTVVATIHQPSTQMFHMFHHLLLLVDGKVAYFGKSVDVITHFSHLGYECLSNYNPADFILEKLKESDETTDHIIKNAKTLCNSPQQICSIHQKPKDTGVLTPITDFNLSSQKTIIETDIHIYEYLNRDVKWATGLWTQYTVLLMRSLKQSSRRLTSKMSNTQIVFYSALIGAMWFQIDRTEENIINIMGLFFFSVSQWGFVSMYTGLFAVSRDKDVILRERLSSTYRISAYYLSVSTSEFLLPMIGPILYYTVIYWMAGLCTNAAVFISSLAIFLLGNVTVQSIGIFMGASISNIDITFPICTVAMATFSVLGDFIRRNLPYWLSWIQYISFVKYTYHTLFTLEMMYGPQIRCDRENVTKIMACESAVNETFISGDDVLKYVNITMPYWINLLILLVMTVTLRVTAYLILKYLKKP